MTVRIVVQPQAEGELLEAYRWYEARRSGLGDELIAEADQAFARIMDAPLRPRALHRGGRRVHPRRFPYVVVYLPCGDSVYILAVLHERRNPRLFRARIRDFGGS